MYRHYSMALQIILEAVESGELEGSVSDVLRGRRKLSVEQISKLCARFNISPATFFPPAVGGAA